MLLYCACFYCTVQCTCLYCTVRFWKYCFMSLSELNWIERYSTVQYTCLHCTLHACSVQYMLAQYCLFLYCTVRFCIVLYMLAVYCTCLHCKCLHCTVRACSVLYMLALYWTRLHCTVLYTLALHALYNVHAFTVLYILELDCKCVYIVLNMHVQDLHVLYSALMCRMSQADYPPHLPPSWLVSIQLPSSLLLPV